MKDNFTKFTNKIKTIISKKNKNKQEIAISSDLQDQFPEDYLIYDTNNELAILKQFAQDFRDGYKKGLRTKFEGKYDKIFICGMGSILTPSFFMEYLLPDIPIFSISDYELPKFANHNSLCLILSYSGNTDEVLSCFRSAVRKHCEIISFTTGGKLKQSSKTYNKKIIELPLNYTSKNIFSYLFGAMLGFFTAMDYINLPQSHVDKIASSISLDRFKNIAIDLAKKIDRKPILIYSSHKLFPLVNRWKKQFNATSKIMAFINTFPDINHNEIESFQSIPADFQAIILRDDTEHIKIENRMDITKRIMQSKINVTEIGIRGHDLILKYLSGVYIGDLTSYYLALLLRRDPSKLYLIETIKKEMGNMHGR